MRPQSLLTTQVDQRCLLWLMQCLLRRPGPVTAAHNCCASRQPVAASTVPPRQPPAGIIGSFDGKQCYMPSIGHMHHTVVRNRCRCAPDRRSESHGSTGTSTSSPPTFARLCPTMLHPLLAPSVLTEPCPSRSRSGSDTSPFLPHLMLWHHTWSTTRTTVRPNEYIVFFSPVLSACVQSNTPLCYIGHDVDWWVASLDATVTSSSSKDWGQEWGQEWGKEWGKEWGERVEALERYE